MNLLRPRCLCVVVLVASWAAVPGPLDASSICTRIEKDTVTVLAAGQDPNAQFALVFSRQAASIVGWYDLDRDPKMTVNLCSHGGGNPFALFQNRAEMIVDGAEVTIFPGAAEEFRVLESSDIRVTVQMRGRFTTPSGEFPGEKLKKGVEEITGRKLAGPERPEYQTRFTVYPTGRIYIRHQWGLQGLPVVLSSNRMILGTAPAEQVVALNDYADTVEAFCEPASFLLHYGTRDGFPASALLVTDYRKYQTDWLGEMMTLDRRKQGWLRSAFAVQGPRAVMQPGKYLWNFMLQVEPANVDSRETARAYAMDYLKPARITFTNGRGALDLAESEDRQMDGFAEGRGCYVVSAAGKRRVEMRIDAGTLTRYCPAFEIRHWDYAIPTFIAVDGYRRHVGVHYNAHLEQHELVIQYLGVLTPGVHTLEFGEEPA